MTARKRARRSPEEEFELLLRPPRDLGATGRAQWRRTIREMERRGILHPLDRFAIHAYCMLLDLADGGEAEARARSGEGKRHLSRALRREVRALRASALESAEHLGLTPAGYRQVQLAIKERGGRWKWLKPGHPFAVPR